MQFEGKVALVTGGASGIGRATALAFAQEGARVVVADQDGEGGAETARMIMSNGGYALFATVDVTQAPDVAMLVEQTVAQYGRLDIAFNNAGVAGIPGLTHEQSEEEFERLISVNLKGVWLCMKYEIPQMLAQGGGVIVNTSSLLGLSGDRNAAIYAASKHGVLGLTKSAAKEYIARGIRINAICPGTIRTPMLERSLGGDPDSIPGFGDWIPAGRIGTPEEVAAAVLWLCSDGAAFVVGHALQVDGGVLA
jgi:NAD(P)-dependent dehydrogenase (short-subunit alcohol dehydrogenase family)